MLQVLKRIHSFTNVIWRETSDVGNRIDGASPCKALIPICNIISKGKLCSNNSKSVLYLPNIYVAVARVAEVSYLLVLCIILTKRTYLFAFI
jgi:hypothetical protein